MEAPLMYELRRPSNEIPGKNYPALFVMHGMGSNEQDMLSLVDGFEEHFFIFSIRGPISQGPGFAFFTIEGFGRPHREVFDDGIHRLTNFIDFACEQYPLDFSRIYLLGFSQGAIVSMTLALILGSKIKGAVALSGYIPQFVKEEYKINTGDKLSVFISHGESDQALPFEWGQDSAAYFSQLGIPVTFQNYPAGHTVTLENFNDFRAWILKDLKEKGRN